MCIGNGGTIPAPFVYLTGAFYIGITLLADYYDLADLNAKSQSRSISCSTLVIVPKWF